jgi:tetratricopeptide (TPR) repeat protein
MSPSDRANDNEIVKLNQDAKALCDGVWQHTETWNRDYAKAKSILLKALEFDPGNTITLTNLGAVFLDTGKHSEGLEILTRAEAIGSSDRNLYFNIGVAMMNLTADTRSKAKMYFNRAASMKASPKTIEAYFDAHGY